jgi:hypothetical protein
MRNQFAPRLLLIIFFLLVADFISAKPPLKGYAIVGVSVIPMNIDTIMDGQTVLIQNDKIKTIGKTKQVKIPKGYKVVDGKGKFLTPGFFDMHAHFYYEQGNNVNTCREELKLMLANGLTTVRIQCGDPVYLDAREKVKKKEWQGPELLVSSPQIVGSWPWGGKIFGAVCTTPEEGIAAVKRFKNEGYDAIKITFMVKKDVFEAIMKTANEVGIKVTGHVGPLVKLPTALAAKHQNDHMDEFIDMLLPDSSYNHGQSVSDMNIWRKKAWETVPFLDEAKIPELVSMVKQADIYVAPTNYFFFSFFGRGIDEAVATSSVQYQYIPQVIKEEAKRVKDTYFKNLPPEESRNKYVYLRKKMTFELWKAGVKLMAGSDSPQWYSAPGFAIHDEMETFVECGLSPFATLQTATVHPATYLGMQDQTGTIEVGKSADLILLDKNPLTDIRNSRSIQGVFADGIYYDLVERGNMLRDAKTLAK